MDNQAERFGQPVAALLESLKLSCLVLPSIGDWERLYVLWYDFEGDSTTNLGCFWRWQSTTDSRKVLSPNLKLLVKMSITSQGQALAQKLTLILSSSNCSIWSHPSNSQGHICIRWRKPGGVLEALALQPLGYIGLQASNADLDTSLTAQLGGFIFTSPERNCRCCQGGQAADDFTLTVNGVTPDGH